MIICCFPTKNEHLSLSLSFSLSLNPYVRLLLDKRLVLHPKWPKPALTQVYSPSSASHHSPEHIRFHTAHNSPLLDSSPRNQMGSLRTLSTKQSASYSQKIRAGSVPCFLQHFSHILLTCENASHIHVPFFGPDMLPTTGGGLISALFPLHSCSAHTLSFPFCFLLEVLCLPCEALR